MRAKMNIFCNFGQKSSFWCTQKMIIKNGMVIYLIYISDKKLATKIGKNWYKSSLPFKDATTRAEEAEKSLARAGRRVVEGLQQRYRMM